MGGNRTSNVGDVEWQLCLSVLWLFVFLNTDVCSTDTPHAFSLGIHFTGYTFLSWYFQDGSPFVCVRVAEQATLMHDCCLVRWTISTSHMWTWVTQCFHCSIVLRCMLTCFVHSMIAVMCWSVSCRSSWKAAYYIDQVTCVSLGCLTLAHECLQVGVVPLTVMWWSYTGILRQGQVIHASAFQPGVTDIRVHMKRFNWFRNALRDLTLMISLPSYSLT
jgi:hypothetical protein